MRRLRHTRVFFALAILVTGITGCSSLLPNSHSEASSFKTFEEARAAIESLIPMQSNQDTLTALGIEAGKQPNTTLLTHADVVRRFVPGSVLTKQDLNAGIVACIEAKDSCRGLEVLASRIDKVRSGNFFADFLNFSRRTDTTGWRFNAVILLVDNVVVYRTWGGQPAVNETEVHKNPLGPLQDVGPSTVTTAR
ncbi:MAG TPA: hypothetical protein PLL83_00885 [Rhodoferax sp.]|nr:hypothetical protein [Rhodoferax sp.]HQY75656.1 hypothetical protein [Rhodoferax sp.]